MRICKYTVQDAGKPLKESGNNDYSCFSKVKEYKGVYVFWNRKTGEVLYVGRAHLRKNGEGLIARVRQHYSERNTGGNFYINWRKEQQQDCATFEDYKNLLRESSVSFFYFDKKDAPDQMIDDLETSIIYRFRPKYNDEIMKMKYIEQAYNCAVCHMINQIKM